MYIGQKQMKIPHFIMSKSVCHKVVLVKGVGRMMMKDGEGGRGGQLKNGEGGRGGQPKDDEG